MTLIYSIVYVVLLLSGIFLHPWVKKFWMKNMSEKKSTLAVTYFFLFTVMLIPFPILKKYDKAQERKDRIKTELKNANVFYKVIMTDEQNYGSRMNIKVRINSGYYQEQLKLIAYDILQEYPDKKVYIFFYKDGMDLDYSAYASYNNLRGFDDVEFIRVE